MTPATSAALNTTSAGHRQSIISCMRAGWSACLISDDLMLLISFSSDYALSRMMAYAACCQARQATILSQYRDGDAEL